MLDTAELTDQQIFNKLIHCAIMLLARREYSAFELSQKLKQNFKRDEVSRDVMVRRDLILQRVISKVTADGYLSDERYADAYVRSRINKGYGFDRIAKELSAKGIAPELIAATLAAFKEKNSEQNAIAQVWQKKFNQIPNTPAEKIKQMRFLFYRGFKQFEIQQFFSELTKKD